MSVRTLLLAGIAVVCWLVSPLPLSGQINTERLRLGAEKAGYSGFFSLSLAAKDGNTDRVSAGVGLRIQHAVLMPPPPEIVFEPPPGWEESEAKVPPQVPAAPAGETSDDAKAQYDPIVKRLVFLVANGDFAEESGERSERRSFAHLRWVWYHSSKLSWETFLQNEFNEFTNLDSRYLLGAGGRWTLVKKPRRELFLGLGLMAESERLDVPEDGPDERSSETWRATSYLSWKWRLKSEGSSLINTLYVQPELDDPSDLRLLNELDLQVPLGERLSLSLAAVVQHDSEPPAGVEETDLSITNSLRLTF
ncbi:MAG: DUF481 domain-containing protein [Acidobacteriota bacterium]